MGKQMVDDELDDQFVHVHHEGQSRGYVDLLPQNPPIPPARRKLLGKRPPPPDWEDLEEDAKRNREVDPRFEFPVEDGLSFVAPPADAADPGGVETTTNAQGRRLVILRKTKYHIKTKLVKRRLSRI